jgi:hypothetical protein
MSLNVVIVLCIVLVLVVLVVLVRPQKKHHLSAYVQGSDPYPEFANNQGLITKDETLTNGVHVTIDNTGYSPYMFAAVKYSMAAIWLDRNLPNIKLHPDVKLLINVSNTGVGIGVRKRYSLHPVKNVTLPLVDNTISSEHDAIAVLNYMEELYPFVDPTSTIKEDKVPNIH